MGWLFQTPCGMLLNHMKGKLYLICGDDDFLVDTAARGHIDRLVPISERDFNLEIIEARKDTGDEVVRIVEACIQSMLMSSFLGGAKVTWLRDAGFLTGGGRASESLAAKAAVERLILFLQEDLKEGQNLIITTSKVLRTSVFFKTCQKQGEVEDFGSGLKTWEREKRVEQQLDPILARMGLEMEEEARKEFLTRAGSDMRFIVQELEKLRTYLHPDVVATVQAIRTITSIGREAEVWDVLDAFGNRNAAALLTALTPLFNGDKGVALHLATMLETNVRDLIILREAHDRKWVYGGGWASHILPEASVLLSVLPVNPKITNAWAVKKKLPHALNYSMQELRAARFRILDLREKLVSTGLPEQHLVESTLLRILGKPRRSPAPSHVRP